MDSNNMYQNQNQPTDNPTPDNNQNGYYQDSSTQGGDYGQNQNTYTNANSYQQNTYTNANNYQQNEYTNANNYQQNTYTSANNYQPNPYNNGGYQQQPYQQPYQQTDLEEPVSLGEWIITLLVILFVPCVNIVMLFVWAFGSGAKRSKSNFCKAALILYAVCLVITLIFGGSLLGIIANELRYY
ncbi:MAG: hypothetical protein NC433_11915 [Clostridiales bacterium]|nr:hypothetical protein [Clostridiales bacterium]